MLSITLWKAAGAFFRPNGILTYLKWPPSTVKAVFGMSSGLISTWWYPLAKSRLEKYLVFPSWFNISLIFGIGFLSETVVSLSFLKSVTSLRFLCPVASAFFYTTHTGALHREWLDLFTSFFSSSFTCFLISCLNANANLYGFLSVNGILCFTKLVNVNGSFFFIKYVRKFSA